MHKHANISHKFSSEGPKSKINIVPMSRRINQRRHSNSTIIIVVGHVDDVSLVRCGVSQPSQQLYVQKYKGISVTQCQEH